MSDINQVKDYLQFLQNQIVAASLPVPFRVP